MPAKFSLVIFSGPLATYFGVHCYKLLISKKRHVCKYLLLLCLTAGAARAQQPVETIGQLKDSIHKIMGERHMPGLMLVLVSRDSTLFAGGIGMANIGSREPVSKTTLFPMGSVTKSFTALAIQRLIAQGKLSPEARLKDLAPEVPFENRWEKAHPLTVSNLLEHTTGFDDVHFNAMFNNERDTSQYHAILKFRRSMICRWYPGERTAYCNTDYVILGYLVQKLSGKSYDQYLKQEILGPLGMSHSTFDDWQAPATGYATGYNWDDGRYQPIPPLHIYGKGEGGLYSCAEDMAKFLRFLLNDGNSGGRQLFSPGTIGFMETPHSSIAAHQGLTTGYGSAISAGYFNLKYPFYGHDGLTTDFSTQYGYNRQLGLGFAVCGADAEAFSELIINFMAGNAPPVKLPPVTALDTVSLSSRQGYYRLLTPRFQIMRYLEEVFHGYHVELRNGHLYCYGFKRPEKELLAVGKNIFRKAGENLPTILLTDNEQHRQVLYDCGTYFEKVPFARVIGERLLLLAGVLSGIFLLFSLVVWLILALFKKLPWAEFGRRSLSAWAAVFLFTALGVLAYLGSNPEEIGAFNGWTAYYFAGTLLFALLNIAALILHFLRFRQMQGRLTKWYLVTTSSALLYLTIFLYHYDLLGLRLWDF